MVAISCGKNSGSLEIHCSMLMFMCYSELGYGGGVPVCIRPARMRSEFCGCRSTNGFLILIRLYLFFVIIKCCALVASTTMKS